MACILGRMLSEENIKFLYYFGGSTLEARNKAVAAFHSEEEFGVMVSR